MTCINNKLDWANRMAMPPNPTTIDTIEQPKRTLRGVREKGSKQQKPTALAPSIMPWFKTTSAGDMKLASVASKKYSPPRKTK